VLRLRHQRRNGARKWPITAVIKLQVLLVNQCAPHAASKQRMGCVCVSASTGADGAAVKRRVPHGAASHDSRNRGITAAPGARGRGGKDPAFVYNRINSRMLTVRTRTENRQLTERQTGRQKVNFLAEANQRRQPASQLASRSKVDVCVDGMGTGPTAAAKDLRRLDLAAVTRVPRCEARS
jgi:hypothetical protein